MKVYDSTGKEKAPNTTGTDVQVDSGGALVGADFQDGGDINFAEAAGVVTATIKTAAVTDAQLEDMAAYTLKMRNAGTTGVPADVKISALTEEAAPAALDWILGEDAAGNLRKYDVGNLPAGAETNDLSAAVTWANIPNANVQDGADATAIHDDTASEISAVTPKATPVAGDFFLIEDSAAANVKKSVTMSALEAVLTHDNLTGVTANEHIDWTVDNAGTDIHIDNITAGDITNAKLADMGAYTLKMRNAGTTGVGADVKISGLTEEAAPAALDWILGEDAAGNLRKYDVGNLPAGAETNDLSAAVTWTNVPDANYPNALLLSGTRAMTGALDMGSFDITEVEDFIFEDAVAAQHLIGVNTPDAGDDNIIAICAGSTASNLRGGIIHIYGNESINTGDVWISAGGIAGANLELNAISGQINAQADLDLNNNNLLQPGTGHDAFSDYVANEHIDWTVDNAGTDIHIDNITDGAVTDAKLEDMLAYTIKMRNAGTTGSGADVKISALTEEVSPAALDWILGEDAAGNLRKYDVGNMPAGSEVNDLTAAVTWANIPNANVQDGADATAIHDNTASEISAVTLKGTPVSGDFILIEDSEAGNVKKHITVGSLPAGAETNDLSAAVTWANIPNANVQDGADATAVHDNQASEISVVTAKATPVAGDFFLIEDSAAANVKKSVTLSAIEGVISHANIAGVVANEHLDWTASVGTIHTDNYIENVPTALSTGTVTATTYGITSDSGTDDVVLVEATTSAAGLLGAAKWDEIVASTSHSALTAAHGATGAVMGTTNTQTVTNKDLTATTNSARHTKTMVFESPTASEDLTMFFIDRAVTVTQVRAVLSNGTATPTVTYQMKHHTDRANAGNALTTSAAVTSITTGTDATLSDATIPADSWVWLETTAQGGTTPEMAIFVEYTDD